MPLNSLKPLPHQRSLYALVASKFAVCGMFALMCLAQPLAADDSVWDALPENTLGAVRIWGSQSVMDRVRDETKLGQILLSPERTEVLANAIQLGLKNVSTDVPEMLEDYGFDLADLPRIFSGESGMAFVKADESAPDTGFVVFWLNPDQELADQLWDALEQWLSEQEDSENSIQVLDLDLGGTAVLNLLVPSGTFGGKDDAFELDELDEFELDLDESPSLRYGNFLLARQAGRLIAVTSNKQVSEDQIDANTTWLGDRLLDLLEAPSDSPGAFAAMLQDTNREAEEYADEDLLCEIGGNLRGMIDHAMRHTTNEEEAQNAIDLSGAQGLESFVLRLSLGQQVMRTYGFVHWPAPRRGIAQLLGQNQAAAAPPAWVPASVMTYTQVNLDLAAVYEVVREEVSSLYPETESYFDFLAGQTQALAQSSVEELLASLGDTHYWIEQVPDTTVVGPEGLNTNPTAFSWQLEDVQLWERLMRILSTFAPAAQMVPTDEQGFRGFRFDNEQVNGGVVLGQGHLVVGVGGEILELVLSSLNNPPASRDALRGSPVFEQATRLVELRPVTSFSMTDGNRIAQVLIASLDTMVDSIEALNLSDVDDPESDEMTQLLYAVVEVLPDAEEAKGILGVVVTEFLVDERGLTLHSVNELPPPN